MYQLSSLLGEICISESSKNLTMFKAGRPIHHVHTTTQASPFSDVSWWNVCLNALICWHIWSCPVLVILVLFSNPNLSSCWKSYVIRSCKLQITEYTGMLQIWCLPVGRQSTGMWICWASNHVKVTMLTGCVAWSQMPGYPPHLKWVNMVLSNSTATCNSTGLFFQWYCLGGKNVLL